MAAAAYVGGLLFGFSPYMVAQTQGHLNLAFVAVIPCSSQHSTNWWSASGGTPSASARC